MYSIRSCTGVSAEPKSAVKRSSKLAGITFW